MPNEESNPSSAGAGRLAGRTALITGGAGGIGKACALLFAAEGADLVVADLSAEAAGAVATEAEALGRRALARALDVSDRAACFELVAECEAEFAPLDVLVSCAGIWSAHAPQPDGLLVDVPEQDLRRVLDVNLMGTLFICQAVAGAMRAAGRPGSIVNLASSSAKIARPTRGPYAISKTGVWMLSKMMAVEMASDGIRVNALAPGYIETPMTSQFPADSDEAKTLTVEKLIADTPMGRIGRAEEVASAALFLASEEASYFTGELLQPTGGWYLG